jgi:hypothetical protein
MRKTAAEFAERLTEPTPKFWRKIRNIAITLGTIGGIIVAAPIALPAAIITVGGYLATAGTVATVLAQSTSTMR